MEIVSLITQIGLKNVKNRGRPIVPHLEVAILKLTSREKIFDIKDAINRRKKLRKKNLTIFF